VTFKHFFLPFLCTYVNLFSLYEFSLKKHLFQGQQRYLAAGQLGISGTLFIHWKVGEVKDCWNY